MLVDAHCHLEAEEFSDRLPEVLAEARGAGIVRLVTASVTPEEWPRSAAIAATHPEVAFAWGIHPWFVREEHLSHMERLAMARETGAVAIGEIGLDKKIESPDFALQQRLFEAQLAVAQAIGLPVVMHCRGAFNELIASLRRVGPLPAGGLVHAFSGSVEVAEECIGLGLSFSMGASLSYKPSKKRLAVLARIYPEHLLLETDSPDMPPAQVPEKPNMPANIRYNLAGAARMLGESEADVAAATTRNAARLFGLRLPQTENDCHDEDL